MSIEMRPAFVYILRCRDDTLYTGWTYDLPARVEAHNAGRGSRYTAARRPVRLVYQEQCLDRAQAMHREAAIKKLSRRRKLALITQRERRMESISNGRRTTADEDSA